MTREVFVVSIYRLSGLAVVSVSLAFAGCGSSEEDGGGSGGATGGSGGATGGSGGATGGSGGATGGSGGATGGAAGSSGGAAGSSTGGAAGSSTGGAAGSSSGGAAGSAGTAGTGGAGGNSANLRFVAMGDCGKGNTGQSEVAAAVAAKCAKDGCDFIQLLGDNFYDNGVDSVNDPQWQTKFEQPYANVTYPFWVVLGNHDYGGNGAGYEAARADVQVAYSKTSTKWKLPAKHYKHAEPGVDFIGLDTNEAMFNAHAGQKTNVTKWIAESTAQWKIAFGHHPYRSNGPHGNAGSYENLPFVPIVNGAGVKDLLEKSVCGKVDVYICGHDHSLQWLTPTCQGTELLVSGGGASNTDLPGNNQTHWQGAHTGFLYVSLVGKTFTGEFIDAQGNVKFTRTITKP